MMPALLLWGQTPRNEYKLMAAKYRSLQRGTSGWGGGGGMSHAFLLLSFISFLLFLSETGLDVAQAGLAVELSLLFTCPKFWVYVCIPPHADLRHFLMSRL